MDGSDADARALLSNVFGFAIDFMKRTTLAKMTPGALADIGPAAARLAESERLEAHGLSVLARLERLNE